MTTDDPRERLIQVGNRLLDLEYQHARMGEEAERARTALSGDAPPDVQVMLDTIQLLSDGMDLRTQLMATRSEYVAIRRTIEYQEAHHGGDVR